MSTATPTVGLVLSAGGPTATAYHAGVLDALAEATGWQAGDAEVVVGTSAGSSAAVMLRAGFSVADEYARVTGAPLSQAGSEFVERIRAVADRADTRPEPSSRRPLSLGLAIKGTLVQRRPGLALAGLSSRGAQSLARTGAAARAASPRWPTRTIWIVTVRVRDGSRAVFGRDDLPAADVGDAVEASSAVPSLYRPIRIGRDEFIDGAVHSSTNADLAAGLGLDAVVIVSSMTAVVSRASCVHRDPLRSYLSRALSSEVRRIRAAGTPVVVFQPTAADLAVRRQHHHVDDVTLRAVAQQARDSALVKLRRPEARAVQAVISR